MLCSLILAQVVAVSGGTVHTLVPGAEARVATLLLEEGKIRAVGADLEIPADALRIEAAGLHVIPGLIDGLVYHDSEHDTLYTSAGVTLLRDHGNDLARILTERQAAQRDARRGPWLSVSGAVLDGFPPSSPNALVLKSEHDAHAYVPTMLAEGIDFLSIQANLGPEAWREIVALAHPSEGTRLQVWGPCPESMSLKQIADGGQDGLTFLDALLPADKTWETVALSDCAESIAVVLKAGLRITPLLRGTARLAQTQDAGIEALALLGPQYGGMWRNELRARREQEGLAERAGTVLARQRELLAALEAAGVPLVPGSGAPHPWLMPGDGLIEELAEWQAAGLAPARCLELATRDSARALGLEDRGTLESGKVADLVLLSADPRQDVTALRAVESVVLRGKPLARADLDADRAKLRAAQDAARTAAEQVLEVAAPSAPEGKELLRGYVVTRTVAGPIAGERWSVVRAKDGALSFCGRRLMPGSAERPPIEAEIVQTVKDKLLESFSVTLRTSGRELAVRGQLVAGQMRIERRLDGGFIDSKAAREALVSIDVSSVTTLLVIAHLASDGPMPILRFDEGLELEVVRWDLKQEEDGDHAVRTPNGMKWASFDENGAVRAAVDLQGQARADLVSMEIDSLGGPGLPLPPAKLERIRKARAAEAAAAKQAEAAPAKDGD
jgi:hypothetical protein